MSLYKINWSKIDTVLLDLDGTILDLSFDDFIWKNEMPKLLAKQTNISFKQAQVLLAREMRKVESTLSWYSYEFWKTTLDIDINLIEDKFQKKIALKTGALDFLENPILRSKRVLMVTNADRNGLERKLEATSIGKYFSDIICSHNFGYAKEDSHFWQKLKTQKKIDFNRTLLIDDNFSVLKTAEISGVKYSRGILRPNSNSKSIESTRFILLESLTDLFY